MKRSTIQGALVGLTLSTALLCGRQASATTITVNSSGDDQTPNGNCTLREAILAVNNQAAQDACPAGNGSNDTIRIPGPGLSLSIGSNLLITRNVTITGDGFLMSPIDAGGLGIAFTVGSGAGNTPTVTFSNFTFQDSSTRAIQVVSGQAFISYVKIAGVGVVASFSTPIAIFPGASATMQDSVIQGCLGYSGGAIVNQGSFTLRNSSLIGNEGEHGGAINNAGTLNIYGSTIGKNRANVEGSAVYQGSGSTSIVSSTIAYNTASDESLTPSACTTTGCAALQVGGGTVTVTGSVVAHNAVLSGPTANVDCRGTVTSTGYNLLGAFSGTGCTRIGTDLTPQSAQLITQTIGSGFDALNWPTSRGATGDVYMTQTTSPLIGAIPATSGLCFNVDQREVLRNKGNTTCDIGSIERSNVLFVQNDTGTTTEQDFDSWIKGWYTTLGFTVTTADDDTATASLASGKHVVFISESVDSTKITTKFRDIANTLVIDEPSLYGSNRFTGTGATDFGDVSAQTSFTLQSQQALGTPMGIMGYTQSGPYSFSVPSPIGFGVPAGTAFKHIMVAGSTTRAATFSYNAGQAMAGSPTFTAPGPRIGFFAQPADFLDDDGRLISQSVLMTARAN